MPGIWRHSFRTWSLSRISDSQTIFSESKDAATRVHYQLIRENQGKVARSMELAIMMNIDGFRFSMLEQSFYKPFLLHFDTKGTVEIGKAIADSCVESMKSTGNR